MSRSKIDNSAIGIRSNQNLSCNWTGTADFGRLVPIHWEELLQSDKVIRFKPRIEMQMLPFTSPTFSKIDLYVHGFVVPIRQIQKDFYDFWSQTGEDKDSCLQYFTPRTFSQFYNLDLTGQVANLKRAFYNHFTSLGLNPFFAFQDGADSNPDDSTPIWLAPFFAYNKIWWDFYRDPELLRDESKRDYLYDGFVNHQVPQGWQRNEFFLHFLCPHIRSIKNNWLADLFSSSGQDSRMNWQDSLQYDNPVPYENSAGEDIELIAGQANSPTPYRANMSDMLVDAGTNTQASVRLIEALTRLSERLSLSGKRQIEALFARYGVKPNWSKVNLARYVGGAKASVLVSDIIASSDTYADGNGLPLGAKAGNGYCALDNLQFEFEVDEPSIFMCIASVMPHIHYVQGISKKWQRKEFTSMFQDSLQYVGNVAVAKREVGFTYPNNSGYAHTEDGSVFAYTDPYYEYKYGQDILAGDFMRYHNAQLPQDPEDAYQVQYMQSMENYIDFPSDRNFEYTNFLVDGDQYNKIFSYLGASLWQGGDDHFHLCVDKDFIVNRPMDGFAIPTLETTQNPHVKKSALSGDKML